MTQQLNMHMPLTEVLSLLHNTHVRWIAVAGPPAPGVRHSCGSSGTCTHVHRHTHTQNVTNLFLNDPWFVCRIMMLWFFYKDEAISVFLLLTINWFVCLFFPPVGNMPGVPPSFPTCSYWSVGSCFLWPWPWRPPCQWQCCGSPIKRNIEMRSEFYHSNLQISSKSDVQIIIYKYI